MAQGGHESRAPITSAFGRCIRRPRDNGARGRKPLLPGEVLIDPDIAPSRAGPYGPPHYPLVRPSALQSTPVRNLEALRRLAAVRCALVRCACDSGMVAARVERGSLFGRPPPAASRLLSFQKAGKLSERGWTICSSVSPWIRFRPLAGRVVAARGQNVPVDSLESLRAS